MKQSLMGTPRFGTSSDCWEVVRYNEAYLHLIGLTSSYVTDDHSFDIICTINIQSESMKVVSFNSGSMDDERANYVICLHQASVKLVIS